MINNYNYSRTIKTNKQLELKLVTSELIQNNHIKMSSFGNLINKMQLATHLHWEMTKTIGKQHL